MEESKANILNNPKYKVIISRKLFKGKKQMLLYMGYDFVQTKVQIGQLWTLMYFSCNF